MTNAPADSQPEALVSPPGNSAPEQWGGVETCTWDPTDASENEPPRLQLTGVVLSPDGSQRIESTQEVIFPSADDWHNHLPHAQQLGQATAEILLQTRSP